ncbi:hypothetical protein AB0C96_22570 [Streptomyces sp. NPDC048506]|uniref:hypothetical protein n=1 Tax=Streptomyces sp. NPDC048506 TaxID=3155028 RepID=UPI00342538E2
MRKDTGTAVPRLWRTLLTVLSVVLALLLGGAATAANASSALAAPSSTKSAGTPPATKPSYDSKEEKTKREVERGQPRGAARTLRTPRHTGRAQPPYHRHAAPDATTASGRPAAGSSTKAASRPTQLPVLHCVFRC